MSDKPVMTATELRKAVSEWAAQGFAVSVDLRRGTADIRPPQPVAADPVQPVDLIQWSRK